MLENSSSFPAILTGMKVQSVLQEHVTSGYAETFGLSPGVLVAQTAPSVERGWCVLCAEFLAGTSGQFSKERRNTEEDTALSLAAESFFASLCFFPPVPLKL